MHTDPYELETRPDSIEEVEKATTRLVTQALYEFREEAAQIFAVESDSASDIGEDITREALDRLGVSRVDVRLFGKVDYKKGRHVFLPEWSVRQALFVDSKAEKSNSNSSFRLQTDQTSMRIRQVRAGTSIDEPGGLPPAFEREAIGFLTTTVFVKYNYIQGAAANELISIKVATVPNGWLQDRYNPSPTDGFWLAGPNAPTRGEPFRTRVSFSQLKQRANWRVQTILAKPTSLLVWDD